MARYRTHVKEITVPNDGFLYHEPAKCYKILIQHLDLLRIGSDIASTVIPREQIESYCRMFTHETIKSVLSYKELHLNFTPPALKLFMGSQTWDNQTIMENGRTALIFSLRQKADFYTITRGAAVSVIFDPLIEILSTTRGPESGWSFGHWIVAYFVLRFDEVMRHAMLCLPQYTPQQITDNTGVVLADYIAPMGAVKVIQSLLQKMKPNTLAQVNFINSLPSNRSSSSSSSASKQRVRFGSNPNDDDTISLPSRSSSTINISESSSKKRNVSSPVTLHSRCNKVLAITSF